MSSPKMHQAHNGTFYADKWLDAKISQEEIISRLQALLGDGAEVKAEPNQLAQDDEFITSAVYHDRERRCTIYLTQTIYDLDDRDNPVDFDREIELGLSIMPVPLNREDRPDLKKYAKQLIKSF